jgi:D-glycero-alpha-D-manno-heptose-7-phosphate kinase
MIISRTPFRISFFGGGTDYPAWYRQHGGSVLSATINKYCYLTVRYLPPFFEHRIRVMYSIIEMCQKVEEIAHPSVRETLRYLKIDRGIEIHHDGDLPRSSGLGSGSAFTVGLLHALHALKGELADRIRLATEGIYIEQDILKETVGSQAQVCAAFGGLNRIAFKEDGAFSVQPVSISPERLEELNSHLMLFYTGIKPSALGIASSPMGGIEQRADLLRQTQGQVERGCALLTGTEDLAAFGSLLHEAWQTKKSLSDRISNPRVNALYESARKAGALGGKLMGAGDGGVLLLFVPPERQKKVRQRLAKLLQVPFKFEFAGSQIIFFDLEENYAKHEEARAGQSIEAFRELETGVQ